MARSETPRVATGFPGRPQTRVREVPSPRWSPWEATPRSSLGRTSHTARQSPRSCQSNPAGITTTSSARSITP